MTFGEALEIHQQNQADNVTDFNTATGTGALQANIGGDANTATGTAALSDNTSGINNTANGVNALFLILLATTTPPTG